MTPVTRPHRFFGRRNRRRGARAGLIAIAIQLLVVLGQALPAQAMTADGNATPENRFVCVVYTAGTQPQTPAPASDSHRTGGGHNTCSICIISSPGSGAAPALAPLPITLTFAVERPLPVAVSARTPQTLPERHPARAPPVGL